MQNLNASELQAVGSQLQGDPNSYENRADIEMNWAIKAMEHANVHYNIITSVDASRLKLTKLDDKIYETFRKSFPDLSIAKITDDDIKTPAEKEKWRNFCESFKEEVEDYNQGTLLRLDCEGDYTPENTTLSVRTQFLAIEIARNREGFNTPLSSKKKDVKS